MKEVVSLCPHIISRAPALVSSFGLLDMQNMVTSHCMLVQKIWFKLICTSISSTPINANCLLGDEWDGEGEVDIVYMAEEECERGGENFATHTTFSAHLFLPFLFPGDTETRSKIFLMFTLCNFTQYDFSFGRQLLHKSVSSHTYVSYDNRVSTYSGILLSR